MEIWPSTSINILPIVTWQGKEKKTTLFRFIQVQVCAMQPRCCPRTRAPRPHHMVTLRTISRGYSRTNCSNTQFPRGQRLRKNNWVFWYFHGMNGVWQQSQTAQTWSLTAKQTPQSKFHRYHISPWQHLHHNCWRFLQPKSEVASISLVPSAH